MNFCPTFAADTKILYGYNFVAHLIIYCFISVVETENRFAVVIFLSENFKKYFLNISEKLHLNSYFSELLVKLDYDREKEKVCPHHLIMQHRFSKSWYQIIICKSRVSFSKTFQVAGLQCFEEAALPQQVNFCEFLEIFQNSFSIEYLDIVGTPPPPFSLVKGGVSTFR